MLATPFLPEFLRLPLSVSCSSTHNCGINICVFFLFVNIFVCQMISSAHFSFSYISFLWISVFFTFHVFSFHQYLHLFPFHKYFCLSYIIRTKVSKMVRNRSGIGYSGQFFWGCPCFDWIAHCDNGQRSMTIVFRWWMSVLLNTIWNVYFWQLSIIFLDILPF